MEYAILIIVGFFVIGFCTGGIELPDNFYENAANDLDEDDFFP